jgi:hypothetical protein
LTEGLKIYSKNIRTGDGAKCAIFATVCFLCILFILIIQGNIGRVLIGILLFPPVYLLWRGGRAFPECLRKYQTYLCRILLFAINLYFTFALVGSDLFLIQSRMTLDTATITLFLAYFVVLYPYGYALLHIFERLRFFSDTRNTDDEKRRVWPIGLICAGIIFTVALVISFGFYPATMEHDGASDHWPKAAGIREITNNHPAAYILFIKLIYNIVPHPYMYVIMQIMLFSGVMGALLTFLYQRGASKKAVIALSFFFAMMPGNFMNLVLVAKDPLFSIFLLWTIYLIIKVMDDPARFCKSPLMICQFVIVVAYMGLIRHNGFLAVAAVCIFTLWMTIRYFKQIKVILLVSFIGSVALMQIIQGPVYSAFNVKNASGPPTYSGPLLHPFSAAMAVGAKLPEDMLLTMERILPLNEWGPRYSRFNRDTFTFRDPRPDYSKISNTEALGLYLRLLALYPDIVIQNRLDGMESLWNIFQSRAYLSYNNKYRIGIFDTIPAELLPGYLEDVEPGENRYYFKSNVFSILPIRALQITSSNKVLDAFVWRAGIYIVIFLYLLLFLIARREKKHLFVMLPSVATLLSLILGQGWQAYRYFWFFQLSVFVFIAYVFLMPGSKEVQEG